MISAIRIDPNIEKTMISIVVVLESELVSFGFAPSEDFMKKFKIKFSCNPSKIDLRNH